MPDNDGGPAFPVPAVVMPLGTEAYPYREEDPGMSLRDYFAAAVLTGLRAERLTAKVPPEKMAHWAYNDADAMLAERAKRAKRQEADDE